MNYDVKHDKLLQNKNLIIDKYRSKISECTYFIFPSLTT